MIGGIISLASYGFAGGGSVGNLLAQLEALGFFSYVLPFLLIFSIVFVILSSVPIFKGNKGVNAVIALAVALMSLQFGFVSIFFGEIFPNFAVALSILLVVIIIFGLFGDPENKGYRWLYVAIGIIAVAVVIFRSISYFGWYIGGSTWLNVNWANAAIIASVIALVIIIISSTKPTKPLKFETPWPVISGERPSS